MITLEEILDAIEHQDLARFNGYSSGDNLCASEETWT